MIGYPHTPQETTPHIMPCKNATRSTIYDLYQYESFRRIWMLGRISEMSPRGVPNGHSACDHPCKQPNCIYLPYHSLNKVQNTRGGIRPLIFGF
jgi:hypothetical protein